MSRFVISLLSFVLALTVVSPFSSKAEEEHKFNQKEVDELAQALQVTFEQSSIKSEGKIIEYQKSTIVNNLQNNKY
ncbi:hypothetical protein [Staphylococcus sp. TE8]|uniref:hypothetical protein n=1 Tax=Staphylococcus sp. TE8 TaxID=1472720 RepID=UPI001E447264|nr:hypothetical protein [Staphylococcus sp. TE8]